MNNIYYLKDSETLDFRFIKFYTYYNESFNKEISCSVLDKEMIMFSNDCHTPIEIYYGGDLICLARCIYYNNQFKIQPWNMNGVFYLKTIMLSNI